MSKEDENAIKAVKRGIRLGALAIFGLIAVILLLKTFKTIELKGNEIAVIQDVTPGIGKGVLNETWTGSKMYCGWTRKVFVIDVGTQKITFDTNANPEAENPPIQVEIGENGGQKAWISIAANYHIDPDLVVKLHNQGLGKTYESVVLKREIVDTVNEISRPHVNALQIFSGTGFVKFKNDIQEKLIENDVLRKRGIIVESVVVYNVALDPAFEAEIAASKLAAQQKITKEQQTLAAKEEANRIFALSQAKVEEARQLANSDKIRMVTDAEAKNQSAILEAEADKQKQILAAQGKSEASIAEAKGIVARGEAQARADALQRDALYDGPSGAWRARVLIAQSQAEKLKGTFAGLKVVPEKAFISIADEAMKPNIMVTNDPA